MATIEKRVTANGQLRYRTTIRLKGSKRINATFDKISLAKKWATQTEAAITEGRYFTSSDKLKTTVGDLIDRYLELVLPQKSEIMQDRQLIQYQYWKKRLGHLLLKDLTPQILSTERDTLYQKNVGKNKKRSSASVNRYLAALSHALTVASNEWGLISDNPLKKVRRMKEPRGRVRFLTEEEKDRLLEACQNSAYNDLYPIVILALSTGARKSEIMNLQWRDIDWQRQSIQFNKTKNGQIRRVPFMCACRYHPRMPYRRWWVTSKERVRSTLLERLEAEAEILLVRIFGYAAITCPQ